LKLIHQSHVGEFKLEQKKIVATWPQFPLMVAPPSLDALTAVAIVTAGVIVVLWVATSKAASSLPTVRDFGWKMKPSASAATSAVKLPTGQRELRIKHDVLKGVTCEMLQWFMERFLDLEFVIQGKTYSAFHVWHPRDHILLERKTGRTGDVLRNGDRFRLKEAFGRDATYMVDDVATVCDFVPGKSFGVKVLAGPVTLGTLVHSFLDVPGGAQCNTHFVIGLSDGYLLKPLVNDVVLPQKFGVEMQKRWLTHNVEEFGCLENFLPTLYSRRGQGMRISLD